MTPRRILVLRALGLGDLLAGVPALRALRRAHPADEIVLAAPEQLREAVRATGAVDRLLVTRAPGRQVPSLRHWAGPPPDLAVDLHGKGPESHRVLAELRPGRLLAHAAPRRAGEPGPPVWRAADHERVRWCRFLAAYGIPADPGDLRLPRPDRPSPAPGAIVVHPGANAAARRWPAERYARVVRALRAADGRQRVVLSGGPGDAEVVSEVAALAGLGPQDIAGAAGPGPGPGAAPAPGTGFTAFASLVAHAAVFLSADTGPAHLAVAYGTPSVTLFGPVPPHLWGPPPGDPRHTALWHPGPPGDPNGAAPDPLLLRTGPDEVLAAVREHLREHLEHPREHPRDHPEVPHHVP
jgi:ADP-heptose:LPS heptosyltransferase